MKLTFVTGIISILSSIWTKHECLGQITFLENFRPTYRFLRSNVFDFVGRSDTQWAYKWNLDRGVSFNFFFFFAQKFIFFFVNRKFKNHFLQINHFSVTQMVLDVEAIHHQCRCINYVPVI